MSYPTAPTLSDIKIYLGDISETDSEILGALEAEWAAQQVSCDVPATQPYDLIEALRRRVARNLAARRVPLATYTAFEGGGGTSTRVPMSDAEINRLEKPWRRLVVR